MRTSIIIASLFILVSCKTVVEEVPKQSDPVVTIKPVDPVMEKMPGPMPRVVWPKPKIEPKPKIMPGGRRVSPPKGCIEFRKRGGSC